MGFKLKDLRICKNPNGTTHKLFATCKEKVIKVSEVFALKANQDYNFILYNE